VTRVMPSIVMEEDGGMSSRIRHPPLLGVLGDNMLLFALMVWLMKVGSAINDSEKRDERGDVILTTLKGITERLERYYLGWHVTSLSCFVSYHDDLLSPSSSPIQPTPPLPPPTNNQNISLNTLQRWLLSFRHRKHQRCSQSPLRVHITLFR
jgi:hypothetical protein